MARIGPSGSHACSIRKDALLAVHACTYPCTLGDKHKPKGVASLQPAYMYLQSSDRRLDKLCHFIILYLVVFVINSVPPSYLIISVSKTV